MSLPNLRRPFLRLGAAALFATVSLARPALAGAPKVGDTFPALAQQKLEGKLPDLQGKVVLVDFWASWCAPCKASFPALKEIHQKYGPQGLTIVAVSIDEDKSDMQKFLTKNSVPFAAVRDGKGTLAEKVDVQIIPSTFLLDASGKILMSHTGYDGDSTKKEFIAAIEAALKK